MIPMQAGKGLTRVASVSNNIYILKKSRHFSLKELGHNGPGKITHSLQDVKTGIKQHQTLNKSKITRRNYLETLNTS